MASPAPVSERVRTNPFYVLELPTTASRSEIERQGQKLLAMLEVKMKESLTYPTPLGRQPRDAEQVRNAMAELREPSKRLVHEVFAALDPNLVISVPEEHGDALAPRELHELMRALGFARRKAT